MHVRKLRWLQTESGERTLQFCCDDGGWVDVPVELAPSTIEPTNQGTFDNIPKEEWDLARERIARFKEKIKDVSGKGGEV